MLKQILPTDFPPTGVTGIEYKYPNLRLQRGKGPGSTASKSKHMQTREAFLFLQMSNNGSVSTKRNFITVHPLPRSNLVDKWVEILLTYNENFQALYGNALMPKITETCGEGRGISVGLPLLPCGRHLSCARSSSGAQLFLPQHTEVVADPSDQRVTLILDQSPKRSQPQLGSDGTSDISSHDLDAVTLAAGLQMLLAQGQPPPPHTLHQPQHAGCWSRGLIV